MLTLETKLGIRHPIFQAPMAGGVLSPAFVAKVSNYGLLGSVPSGYLSLDQVNEFVERVKKQTSKPFSLNLFVDYEIYNTDINIKKPDEIIAAERAYDNELVTTFCLPPQPFVDDLVQLAINCAVPVVSTTFGLLDPAHVTALKAAGIKIMTTINCVYELETALKTQHPDVLIYQSVQAGGHKGGNSSLPYSEEVEIIDAVKRHSDIHCVLAGAIVNKQDISMALSKGFNGVQIGTGFLATQESSASCEYKKAILENTKTAFTASITGRPARGLANRISRLVIQKNLGFPYMHYATTGLRRQARSRGDLEFQSLWCGDGISKIHHIHTLDDYLKSLTS
jgi:nitronate monooxygenase